MGKVDVWQGTLALMILKTVEALGPLHGYGIARRIEQTSGKKLVVNYGTLYPALLKLEQEGFLATEWGTSENGRRARFYSLTRAGRRQRLSNGSLSAGRSADRLDDPDPLQDHPNARPYRDVVRRR